MVLRIIFERMQTAKKVLQTFALGTVANPQKKPKNRPLQHELSNWSMNWHIHGRKLNS